MKNILNFSEAFKIGLHAMQKLAFSGMERLSIKSLAGEIEASEYHLSKVMQRLVKNGFVDSVNGPCGGFTLVKPAKKITLMEIYEAIEGRFEMTNCMYPVKICNKKNCPIEKMIKKTTEYIRNYFSRTSLFDIIE